MSAHNPHDPAPEDDEPEDSVFLDADDAAEEIEEDEDAHMDEDDDEEIQEEYAFQNDSVAHFDAHTDSIFCIAQHPTNPAIVATGGGDDVAFVYDSTPTPGPVLPSSYESNPQPKGERAGQEAMAKLDGHSDSVNGVLFTLPKGEFVVSAGLDGKLRAWADKSPHKNGTDYKFLAETQEVEEINWMSACPAAHANTIALGANDGSVWVYTISDDPSNPLAIVQAFYLHTASCTAGAWTPDGKMLATVSEDGTFNVFDVWGDAVAAGITASGQTVIQLSTEDQRFAVEGGLYSVAIAPSGAFAAVGGAEGNIRIVGLPRIGSEGSGARGGGAKNKAGGARKAGGPSGTSSAIGQAGQLLASLQAQTDGVETLAFSQPPLNLLAAGSVDGSIVLYDTAHRFAIRRHIKEAHEEFAVVKVEFVNNPQSAHVLTSAGMDGVVRRWDTRGGTAAAGQGFLKEWRGHRGEGEGGGVLGFVQGGGGSRIVTAGDDGISLVFKDE